MQSLPQDGEGHDVISHSENFEGQKSLSWIIN